MFDLESFEALAQDQGCRQLLTRMRTLLERDGLDGFLDDVAVDPDLPLRVKVAITEIASDEHFVYAVGDYLDRTALLH